MESFSGLIPVPPAQQKTGQIGTNTVIIQLLIVFVKYLPAKIARDSGKYGPEFPTFLPFPDKGNYSVYLNKGGVQRGNASDFPVATGKEIKSVFSGDMRLGKNSSHGASVRGVPRKPSARSTVLPL
jgi:hypothetical protein